MVPCQATPFTPIDKTQSLVFNFTPTPELKNRYRFNWDSPSIKYLGVTLIKDISQLYTSIYNHITVKIRKDRDRWTSLPLDFGNRILTIKTNILPRLLHLFQSLPIPIPNSQFSEWDKFIFRFIWSGKAPRIRYTTLQLSKRCGGMSLQSLKDYYLASQIRPLMLWCNQEYFAKWKVIELSLSDKPPQCLLGYFPATKHNIKNRWVKFSIEI